MLKTVIFGKIKYKVVIVIRSYWHIFLEKYHQKKGIRLLGRSRYKEAFQQFERALLLNDSTVNYFYYSVCLISMNRHRQAIGYLEKIFDKHDDMILISTTLAECYLVVRDWCKADDFLGFLVNKYSENVFIKRLWDISQDPILREKYASSKEYFYKAVEELEIKNYTAALEQIKQAIVIDELNSVYYFFAGIILLQAKSPKHEVEDYLEKALALSPYNEQYKKKLHWVKTRYKL